MTDRTVEDRLREEYSRIQPGAEVLREFLETTVRSQLLPLRAELKYHERLEVRSRVKDCESAIAALRRRKGTEANLFDLEIAEAYSLTQLNDLVGVRILAFPPSILARANQALFGSPSNTFTNWQADQFPPVAGISPPFGFKYHGSIPMCDTIRAEIQLVPMLVGLFWQVEHAALYKPSPNLKDASATVMQEEARKVVDALLAFEKAFEKLL